MLPRTEAPLNPELEARKLAVDECYMAVCNFYSHALRNRWGIAALVEIEGLVDTIDKLRVKR